MKAYFITHFYYSNNSSPHTGWYLNYNNYLLKSQIAESEIIKIKFLSKIKNVVLNSNYSIISLKKERVKNKFVGAHLSTTRGAIFLEILRRH